MGSKALKTIVHPTHFKILISLADKPKSSSSVAKDCNMTRSNIYKQIQKLVKKGYIKKDKKYYLNYQRMLELFIDYALKEEKDKQKELKRKKKDRNKFFKKLVFTLSYIPKIDKLIKEAKENKYLLYILKRYCIYFVNEYTHHKKLYKIENLSLPKRLERKYNIKTLKDLFKKLILTLSSINTKFDIDAYEKFKEELKINTKPDDDLEKIDITSKIRDIFQLKDKDYKNLEKTIFIFKNKIEPLDDFKYMMRLRIIRQVLKNNDLVKSND